MRSSSYLIIIVLQLYNIVKNWTKWGKIEWLYSIYYTEPVFPFANDCARVFCSIRDQTPACGERQVNNKISDHRTSYALESLDLDTSYQSVMLQTKNKWTSPADSATLISPNRQYHSPMKKKKKKDR